MNQQRNKIQSKIYSLLSLAMKAGKLVSGEFATDKSVKSGSAWVVLVSEDASAKRRKSMKSSLAITDENFAKSLIKHLEQSVNCEGEEE